jgi:hypothetical protein
MKVTVLQGVERSIHFICLKTLRDAAYPLYLSLGPISVTCDPCFFAT